MSEDLSTELAALQRLLNEWDPIGVYDAESDFPDDEYDCLYYPLLGRLQRGETAREIADYLLAELRDHFGITGVGHPYAFAEQLVGWWSTGPQRPTPLSAAEHEPTHARIVEGEPPGTSSRPVGWPPVFRDPSKPKHSKAVSEVAQKKRAWWRRRKTRDA